MRNQGENDGPAEPTHRAFDQVIPATPPDGTQLPKLRVPVDGKPVQAAAKADRHGFSTRVGDLKVIRPTTDSAFGFGRAWTTKTTRNQFRSGRWTTRFS